MNKIEMNCDDIKLLHVDINFILTFCHSAKGNVVFLRCKFYLYKCTTIM